MKSIALALLFLTACTASGETSVALPKTATLRFIVAGDAGTGNAHLHNGIHAVMKQMHIDAILLVGDNVYPCGVESPTDPNWRKVTVNFGDAGIPVYPVLGNHDYGDPIRRGFKFEICGHPSPAAQVEATGQVPEWHFPARNYMLRSPLVDIFMIDSQPLASGWKTPFLGSDTAEREMADLTVDMAKSRALWRIVLGHHTIFSSGIRGEEVHTEEKNMRHLLLPVLREEHADLYICGHDHDAELIGSLKRKAGEPLFLISGNGAASTEMHARPASAEPATIFPTHFPPPPLIGFSIVEITPHTLTITFYDASGKPASSPFVVRDR